MTIGLTRPFWHCIRKVWSVDFRMVFFVRMNRLPEPNASGYLTGRPGQVFDPDAAITGGEIAVILCRVVGARTENVSGSVWYESYVAALENYDILYPQFDADAYASRAQCCFSLSILRERRT